MYDSIHQIELSRKQLDCLADLIRLGSRVHYHYRENDGLNLVGYPELIESVSIAVLYELDYATYSYLDEDDNESVLGELVFDDSDSLELPAKRDVRTRESRDTTCLLVGDYPEPCSYSGLLRDY